MQSNELNDNEPLRDKMIKLPRVNLVVIGWYVLDLPWVCQICSHTNGMRTSRLKIMTEGEVLTTYCCHLVVVLSYLWSVVYIVNKWNEDELLNNKQ